MSPKVYLAGKIDKNDWRHSIVPDLRGANRGGVLICKEGLYYVGPFFTSCDHGCFHGESQHGRGISKNVCSPEEIYTREQVFRECRDGIVAADYVFVWLESSDAFGTLVELGIAHELKKPIFLAFSENIADRVRDFWFAETASTWSGVYEKVEDAWIDFYKAVVNHYLAKAE